MKLVKLALLLGCMFLILACEAAGCEFKGDAQRNLNEEVKVYPVSFTGGASVATPYDAATCIRPGSATLVAGDDQTCSLVVSFPRTYTDIQGQCVDAGDTEAWLLKGTFVKGYQVCYFESCNDNADYTAAGFVRFYPDGTDSATSLRCLVDGKSQVSIDLPPLKP